MFEIIAKKLKQIFGNAGDSLPENPSAAEIDNFLDDVIAATEKVEKGNQDDAFEKQLKEQEETIQKLQQTIEDQNTVITEMNTEFGNQLKELKSDFEKQMKEAKSELDGFRDTVKEDIKNLKIGKSKDILEQEKQEKQEKEDSEGKRGIIHSSFMEKFLQ